MTGARLPHLVSVEEVHPVVTPLLYRHHPSTSVLDPTTCTTGTSTCKWPHDGMKKGRRLDSGPSNNVIC